MRNSSKFKPFIQLFTVLAMLTATACSTASKSGSSSASSTPETADASAVHSGGNGSPADFDHASNVKSVSDGVQPGYQYEIGSSDPGINGKFRVEFEGKLRLNYGVVIETLGLTESELRSKIVDAYRAYMKSPDSIRVTLVQKKLWVDLRGLVTKPGRYLIDNTASLDEILKEAGGVQANSTAEFIQVQSPYQNESPRAPISLTDYYDTGNASKIPQWQGGSILFVQRKSDVAASANNSNSGHPAIQMLGEVRNPGELTYRDDADFLYYLTKAGGPSPVADLTKIDVIRWVDGRRVNTRYNWEESHQLTHLEPNDLVVIQSNQLTPFEKAMQAAGGLGGILSAIGILIIAL